MTEYSDELNFIKIVNDKVVFTNTKPIVLDIYTNWCGHCKQMMIMLPVIEKNYPNVDFIKLDADKHKKIVGALRVQSLPILFYIKAGGDSFHKVGIQPSTLIVKNIETII